MKPKQNNCLHCKKEYIGYGIFYCSKSCRAKDTGVGNGIKTGKYVPCFLCKKETWKKGSLLNKGRNIFCSKQCLYIWNGKNLAKNFSGERAPNWKGGTDMGNGRIVQKQNGKKVVRARKIVQSMTNFILKDKNIVHHIDGNPANDSKENLFVFRNQSAHLRWHHFLRRHGLKGLLVSNI